MRRGRLPSAILAAIVALRATPNLHADPPVRGADDWTRIVPADVSLFVEIRDLSGIQAEFQRRGIWDVVRKLSQPEQVRQTDEPWARRAEKSLGLHPDEAIRRVLGRRAALVATHAGSWRQGVLLAEVPNSGGIRALLRKWRAKPLAPVGPVDRYRLRGEVILAIRGSTLVFGPVEGAEGLWGRTVHLLSGGDRPSLGTQSEFAGLKWRLSDDQSGFAFVKWRDTVDSAVDPNRLMIGFTVGSSGVSCEVHGRRAAVTSGDAANSTLELPCLGMGRLPASTIACWSSSFDSSGFTRRIYQERFPSDLSVIEMFLSFFLMLPGSGEGQDMLGPRFMFLVDSDAGEVEDRFESPRVSVVLESAKPDALADQLEAIVRIFVSLTMFAREGSGGPIEVQEAKCGGLDVRFVDLRSIASGGVLSALPKGTELCWLRLNDRVVLSTSRKHLESIIRAARRGGSTRGAFELSWNQDGAGVCESVFLKGVEVSRMLSSILAFTRREYPEALGRDWWQRWAKDRLRQRLKLGLGLQDDPTEPGRAVVAEIGPFSPANGRVILGDVIVEAGGSPLPTTRPAGEIARRYRNRGDAETFSLKVLRGGKMRQVILPVRPKRAIDLAGFDPPEALRNLTALLSNVDHLEIHRLAKRRQFLHATAKVSWRREDPKDE